MPNKSIAIDLSLNDAQRDALVKIGTTDQPLTPTGIIAGLAQGAIEDLAAGGLMLSPASVSRLKSSVQDVYDEESLVAAIEKGAMKSGDALVVQYAIDPIYVTPLADVAASNGMALADLVQQCISSVFELGWFYEMSLDSRTITFTVEQYDAIRSKIGREQIFGKDVADYMSRGIQLTEPLMYDNSAPFVGTAQIAAPEVVKFVNEFPPPDFDTIARDLAKESSPVAEEEEVSLFSGVV